jgi:hypothetical protein
MKTKLSRKVPNLNIVDKKKLVYDFLYESPSRQLYAHCNLRQFGARYFSVCMGYPVRLD